MARPRHAETRPPRSVAFVAFRGTADREDTYTNLKAHQADFEPVYAQGRVHAGFAERAANVNCDPLANLFKRYENVVFAGHSLGGAVASLVLLRCLVSGVPRLDAADVAAKARCVTFGAPVGTNGPPTARSVFERVEVAEPWRDLFLHVVHGDDPVPRRRSSGG